MVLQQQQKARTKNSLPNRYLFSASPQRQLARFLQKFISKNQLFSNLQAVWTIHSSCAEVSGLLSLLRVVLLLSTAGELPQLQKIVVLYSIIIEFLY